MESRDKNQEITLKEIILKVREFTLVLFSFWKPILLLCILSGTIFLYRAMSVPIYYNAKLTFMVDQDEGNGMGGVSSILGQFGFGGGGQGKFNLDKIIELMKTRKIISMSLFEKVIIKNKEDFLANHMIELLGFQKIWKEKNNDFQGFYFKTDSIDGFNKLENRVLKKIYSRVKGNHLKPGILDCGYNDDTGILYIKCKTEAEAISIHLTEALFQTLSKFYVSKTIAKQRNTYNLIKNKVDSLEIELRRTNYALLDFHDSNRSLELRKYEARKFQMQTELKKLAASYTETYRNLEIAQFSLNNKMPFIVTIDKPIPPLLPVKESKRKALLIGLLLGLGISSFIIIARKIIKDILA